MHSDHFCPRAGVLGDCVCPLSPTGQRQAGRVKSSLFEAPGWGRALASYQRPRQSSFLQFISGPDTQASCASSVGGSDLQVDKGRKACHVLQQHQGLMQRRLHVDVHAALPQAAQAGLGHMVAVPHAERAQRGAVFRQSPRGGVG